MKVLIAEDHEDTRMILKAYLESEGYSVTCAANGREALEIARRDPPELIVSDILMPEMDGFELCRAIKQDQTTRRIPFIFYTATYVDHDDRQLAMALGAADFIVKPATSREFLNAVRQTLEKSRGQLSEPAPAAPRELARLDSMHKKTVQRKLEEKVRQLQLEQQQLKESETRYRTLFESSADAIMVLDENTFIDCNQATVAMFGCRSRSEFIGTHPDQWSPPRQPGGSDSKRLTRRYIRAALQHGSVRFEWTHRRTDGSHFPAEVSLTSFELQGRMILQAIVREITERKCSEQILRLQSAALNASANAIVITDRQGTIQWTNPAWTRLTGYSAEEAVGKNPRILKSGNQDRAFYRKLWETILSGRVWTGEMVNQRKNGALYTERQTITPVCSRGGEITHFIGIKEDITVRKHAERALRESEERFRTAFLTNPDAINISLLEDGTYVDINDGFTAITGYTREEVIGKSAKDLDIWEDLKDREWLRKELFAKGQVENFEARFRLKNGRIITGLMSARVITLKNRPHILAITKNIEKIKRLETERERLLAESESARRHLHFLLSATPAVIYSCEIASPYRSTFISDNVLEQLGYEPRAFLDDPHFWLNHLHPDDRDKVIADRNHLLKQDSHHHEYRFRHADGRYRWMFDSLRLIRDKSGKPTEIVGYWIDITQRRETEKALQESERRLRAAQRIARIGSWEMELPGKRVSWSEETSRIFELPSDRREGTCEVLFSRIHPDDRNEALRIYEESVKNKTPYQVEHRLLFPDGRIKWILGQGRTHYGQQDKPVRTLGTVMDITERKLAEISLKESEERFRSVFEHTGTGVVIIDRNGTIVLANRDCKTVMGHDPKALQGTKWMDYIPDENLPKMLDYFKLRFDHPERIPSRYETRIVHADGTIRECLLCLSVIPTLDRLVVSLLDISDRVQAERERELLATAIEHATEAVFITDLDNRIIYTNRVFEQLYGYQRDEVIGQTPSFLKSERHDRDFFKRLKATIYGGKPWRGLVFNRRSDGSLLEVHATITPITDEWGMVRHFVSVHRDVSREREAERRLRQSQRLEAIGTLAGGIAHDFNNVLTPIVGFTDLCLFAAPNGSKLYNNLKQIQLAANRARDLVQQILTFSRQSVRERQPLLLLPIVKETLKLLRSSIPTTIEIRRRIEPVEVPVLADPTEIHQIVMNLGTNAYQAMPEGGILTVALETVEVDAEFAALHPGLEPGTCIKLTVRDTGSGIPQEILDKIFEPYFTTKEDSGGTGLGLATVHGIVTSCGGTITVYSEPGMGTEFNVYLPTIARKPAAKVSEEQAVAGGNERILLVDDESAIAELGANILTYYGYQVTYLTQPRDALDLLRRNPAMFDLLITDMTMPELTGEQLALEAKELRPDLPVILCTGFSERMNAIKARRLGIDRFVSKPYSSKNLAAVIRELLAEKPKERTKTQA